MRRVRQNIRSPGRYLYTGLAQHVAGMQGTSVRYSVGYEYLEQVSSVPGSIWLLRSTELLFFFGL
jgi:hypothetical protein